MVPLVNINYGIHVDTDQTLNRFNLCNLPLVNALCEPPVIGDPRGFAEDQEVTLYSHDFAGEMVGHGSNE